MTDRERLIELIHDSDLSLDSVRLADYLLENGVIIPPCKVGDTVYKIFEGEICELTVISCSALISNTIKQHTIHTTNYRGAVLSLEISDFGKTAFLTREEAEQALKERDNNAET